MDELIKQAPMNIDEKIIKEIYEKNNGNIMNSLMELWEIKDENVKEQTKEQKEWDEIRDTCDIFDGEMNNMMAKLRTKVI
jgi:hypothetical protein